MWLYIIPDYRGRGQYCTENCIVLKTTVAYWEQYCTEDCIDDSTV